MRSSVSGVVPVCLAATVLACSSGAYGADEWITVNKDYSSQRYVDLDQITPQNVSGLKELCELQLNEASWFSSGLLMVGRTIYVSTLRATYAIDASSCELRWRTVIELGQPANISSRGPAYLDGMIFRGTADGRVIALDADTGRVLWDQQHADPKKGESFVAAPIAWDGKVFIGIAISDLGIRGNMMAIDAKTGRELWRFYTVPMSVTTGVPSWGGGGFWSTFSLDPATGEVFGPVANPAPDYNTSVRPGDNLYTNSVIALDAGTGRLNWYYQVTPRDDHDWDYGTAPTLYRYKERQGHGGRRRQEWIRGGLDRASRAVVFNTPADHHFQQWADHLGNSSASLPGLRRRRAIQRRCLQPGDRRALRWRWSIGVRITPNRDAAGDSMKLRSPKPSRRSTTAMKAPCSWIMAFSRRAGSRLWMAKPDACSGNIRPTGKCWLAWSPQKAAFFSPATFAAISSPSMHRNGSVLKHIDAGGALNSGLISYAVDGKQYVAAAVGGVTLNSAGVSGPLKVSIFALQAGDRLPKILKLDRLPNADNGSRRERRNIRADLRALPRRSWAGAYLPIADPLSGVGRSRTPGALSCIGPAADAAPLSWTAERGRCSKNRRIYEGHYRRVRRRNGRRSIRRYPPRYA